nr:hypothetical protein [Pseudanabaena sp. UWO311]
MASAIIPITRLRSLKTFSKYHEIGFSFSAKKYPIMIPKELATKSPISKVRLGESDWANSSMTVNTKNNNGNKGNALDQNFTVRHFPAICPKKLLAHRGTHDQLYHF